MDKSSQPSNQVIESTQLNGKADKLTAKSRSKTKVKSDIPVNNDNQVSRNNQPDLFKSEFDVVNTIIPDGVNIDYNTLIEQSIVKTPDTKSASDTTADPDTSSASDESSSLSSLDDLIHLTEKDETDNAVESDVQSELVEPKATRISAKQRKEELDRFKTAYLTPHKFEKKHNVAIEDENWKQLERIARILGDRGSNATSYINAILSEHLKTYASDIEVWRKL